MYQIKMFDEITKSWKASHVCTYAQAIDHFDSVQRKVRSGDRLQHEFIDIEITALKLVEVGDAPGYRERNVLKYTEIRRKK